MGSRFLHEPMKWHITARREFDRLLTSRGIVCYGVVLAVVGILYTTPANYVSSYLGPATTIGALQLASYLVVPFAAVLYGYRSISGERESGTMKFTVGVPQTRLDAIVGVFAGRFLVLAVATLAAYVVVAIAGSLRHGLVPVGTFLAFCMTGLLYVGATLSFGVGVSALTRRSLRAATVSTVYVVLSLFWVTLWAAQLYQVVTGQQVDPRRPSASLALFLLQRLAPIGAFRVASNWVLGLGNSAASFDSVVLDLRPNNPESNAFRVEQAFGGDVPLSLDPLWSFLVLALWCVLPICIGYAKFRRDDLL